jgi:hypothetical protein
MLHTVAFRTMARALPPPTREQQAIVDAFAAHNVLVDAVAGSGKTTTILSIVATFPALSFLVLTYNARLRHETRRRAPNVWQRAIVASRDAGPSLGRARVVSPYVSLDSRQVGAFSAPRPALARPNMNCTIYIHSIKSKSKSVCRLVLE